MVSDRGLLSIEYWVTGAEFNRVLGMRNFQDPIYLTNPSGGWRNCHNRIVKSEKLVVSRLN